MPLFMNRLYAHVHVITYIQLGLRDQTKVLQFTLKDEGCDQTRVHYMYIHIVTAVTNDFSAVCVALPFSLNVMQSIIIILLA